MLEIIHDKQQLWTLFGIQLCLADFFVYFLPLCLCELVSKPWSYMLKFALCDNVLQIITHGGPQTEKLL